VGGTGASGGGALSRRDARRISLTTLPKGVGRCPSRRGSSPGSETTVRHSRQPRHNVGRVVVEPLAERLGASFKAHRRGRADVAETRLYEPAGGRVSLGDRAARTGRCGSSSAVASTGTTACGRSAPRCALASSSGCGSGSVVLRAGWTPQPSS
jgi:hypothetical protein